MKKRDLLLAFYIFCLFFISSFIITPLAYGDFFSDPLGISRMSAAGIPVLFSIMSIPFTFGITIAVSVVAGGLILIGYGLSRLKSRQ